MDFFIQFTYPWILYGIITLLLMVALYRWYFYKNNEYHYSLASLVDRAGFAVSERYKHFLFFLRTLILIIFAMLVAKPRIIDHQSKINGEGIDMVLVLDVSNSMQLVDDAKDVRCRLDIAKEEAIHFIENRRNDPIGLVIFGRDAVSRCPLTLDKNILKEIIKDIHIGIIDASATLLYSGIIVAANRLKDCKGKSKIMIVLTDGDAYEDDKTKEQAVAVAQKFGIKIYTIGIGHDGIVYVNTLYGIQPIQGINKEDLRYVAENTGGRFFEAKKPHDMKAIYSTIDRLEKTEYETTIFTHYYDIFKPFLLCVIVLLLVELLLTSFVWFTL